MPYDGTDFNLVPAIIDRAKELLGPNGENWIKGSWQRGGAMCLGTALRRAIAEVRPGDNRYQRAAVQAFDKVAPYESVPGFNDFDRTTFADILRFLDRSRSVTINHRDPPPGDDQIYGVWSNQVVASMQGWQLQALSTINDTQQYLTVTTPGALPYVPVVPLIYA